MQYTTFLYGKNYPYSEDDIKCELLNIEILIKKIKNLGLNLKNYNCDMKLFKDKDEIKLCFNEISTFIEIFSYFKYKEDYFEKCLKSIDLLAYNYKNCFNVSQNISQDVENYRHIYNIFDELKKTMKKFIKKNKIKYFDKYFYIEKYIQQSINYFFSELSEKDKHDKLIEKIIFLEENLKEDSMKNMKIFYDYIQDINFVELNLINSLNFFEKEIDFLNIELRSFETFRNNFVDDFNIIKQSINSSKKITEKKIYVILFLKKFLMYVFYFRNFFVCNYYVNFWSENCGNFNNLNLLFSEVKNVINNISPRILLITELEKIIDVKTCNKQKCTICLENDSIIAFSCGHKYTCSNCSIDIVDNNNLCPYCRKNIDFFLRIFDT